MTVSTRNTLIASAGILSVAIFGGVALAGGGSGGGKGPTHGGGSHGGACCNTPKGPSVIVPGVNITGPNVVVRGSNVSVHQGSIVSNTQSFINTSIVSGGESSVIVSGGGGFYAPQGVAPSAISTLTVEGGEETITEIEEYCEDQISVKTVLRPVQAVCLDDKGVPHPASQVDPEDRVAPGFEGEIFRCMAGTNMQVTMGMLENGTVSFTTGETFACQKGEALVHKADGTLVCAIQQPERSCNERSLLRRHGAGIKLVEYKSSSKICVPRTRTVTRTVEGSGTAQSMVLDGGVGQGVY